MLTLEVGAAWQQAQRLDNRARVLPWSALQVLQVQAATRWQRGEIRDSHHAPSWDTVPECDRLGRLPWGWGAAEDLQAAAQWDQVPARDSGLWLAWDRSIRAQDVRLRLIYNPKPARKDTAPGVRYQRSDEFGPRRDAAQIRQASLYVPGSGPLVFAFDGARYSPSSSPLVFFDFRYDPPNPPIQPVDSGASPGWGTAQVINRRLSLRWGWGIPTDPVPTGIRYPDYPGPVIVIDPPEEPDLLETYMIANTVSLVVLPDRTPVDATNIRVGLDIDSFSWSFSADLMGEASLNLVKPGNGGQKSVELNINGWTWVLLVERYSRQKQFPAVRYTISGATRTQLLAEPYAPKRSAVNTQPITARQAAEDQLASTGFTLNWDSVNNNPPDWTLPAGALTYQDQTAMQVIARIAEAVGGVVRPSRDGDALTVLPRYREAVWFWEQAVPDCILDADFVTGLGGEWAPQPRWNSCYVSGINFGVSVDVRRAGSSGDRPAPDVFDDLLTDATANRYRGICEISKGGEQELVTKSLPLFPVGGSAPGLVLPAMLCEVRGDGETWMGLCLSVEISATGVGASRVEQSVRLERHTEEL